MHESSEMQLLQEIDKCIKIDFKKIEPKIHVKLTIPYPEYVEDNFTKMIMKFEDNEELIRAMHSFSYIKDFFYKIATKITIENDELLGSKKIIRIIRDNINNSSEFIQKHIFFSNLEINFVLTTLNEFIKNIDKESCKEPQQWRYEIYKLMDVFFETKNFEILKNIAIRYYQNDIDTDDNFDNDNFEKFINYTVDFYHNLYKYIEFTSRTVETKYNLTDLEGKLLCFNIRNCFMENDQADFKIKEVYKILEINVDELDVIENIGFSFLIDSKFKASASIYITLLFLCNSFSINWRQLGIIMYYLGHYTTAVYCFHKAHLINPYSSRVPVFLAFSLFCLGAEQEAIKIVKILKDSVWYSIELPLRESLERLVHYTQSKHVI